MGLFGRKDVREAQDRAAWNGARLAAQLDTPTVRSPQKRFASGDLPVIDRDATAQPTVMYAQRLMLQSEQVAAQLSLDNPIAGPGTV